MPSREYFQLVTIGNTTIYSGSGDPNGVVTASQGSLFMSEAGAAYVNTDGATTWLDLAALGALPTLSQVLGTGNTTGGNNTVVTNGDQVQGEDNAGSAGGDVVFRAGDNTDNTDIGGSYTSRAGSGDTGGAMTQSAGQGNVGAGGSATFGGGDGATDGGTATFKGGDGAANGGDATLQGGSGGGGAGDQGGAARSVGADGDPAGPALLQGGNGVAGASGADATVRGGDGTGSGGHARMEPGNNGSALIGTGALATTAVEGFCYIPSMPGVPTGVPTAQAGLVPFVFDSVNDDLYAYIGGSWVSVTLT